MKTNIDLTVSGEIIDTLPLLDAEHMATLLKITRYFAQTSDRDQILPEVRKKALRALKRREDTKKALNREAKHRAAD